MPYRNTIIIPGEIYHVFNRSIARQPLFGGLRDYQRALSVIEFYSYKEPGLRFSFYNRLPLEQRNSFLLTLKKRHEKLLHIHAFCLMPNHVHFLLEGIESKGVTRFMSQFQNSYAKYLNTKSQRNGALFQSMFKAVRIETDEQFIHVARYIHLNPLTSYVIQEEGLLEGYPWSSYMDYVGKRTVDIVYTKRLTSMFPSVGALKEFTLDQVDYQRKLEEIKHLTFE